MISVSWTPSGSSEAIEKMLEFNAEIDSNNHLLFCATTCTWSWKCLPSADRLDLEAVTGGNCLSILLCAWQFSCASMIALSLTEMMAFLEKSDP